MNRTNLLLSAFIASLVFILSCSSDCEKCDNNCEANNPSSSSVRISSSSDSGSGGDIKLTKKNITISSVKSYADIDGEPVAYTENDAKNNLTKIDLVAYCRTDNGYCKNNAIIYKPEKIDLFMDPDFKGSYIFLFEVPPEKSDIFKTATRYSEIYDTLKSLNLGGSGVKEIPIEEGKVFFVATSEDKLYATIIKAIGNQSVDLEVILIPTK